MPTRHLGSLAKNSSILLRDNFCRRTTCPAASTPCTRKTDFAISNPIVVTCFIVALLDSPADHAAGGQREPSTSSEAEDSTSATVTAYDPNGKLASIERRASSMAVQP